MSTIIIKRGTYRNQPVVNAQFTLVKDFQTGARGGFVTVDSAGYFGPEHDVVRVKVDSIDDIEFTAGAPVNAEVIQLKPAVEHHHESDEEVMDHVVRGHWQ